MKTKNTLKIYAVAVMASICALAACTAVDVDNKENEETDTNVLLSISVNSSIPATRNGYTNQTTDQTFPVIHHIHAFFLSNGKVIADRAAELTMVGQTQQAKLEKIPAYVTKMYVIGYPDKNATSPVIPVGSIATQTELLAIKLDADKQNVTDGKQGIYVNTFGDATLDFHSYKKGDTAPVTVDMAPALSRLEIYNVTPNAKSDLVKIPIDKFTLDNIYINNVYTKLGLDGTTHADGDALHYGGNVLDNTSVWGDPATHYASANYYDVVNKGPATSVAPSTSAGHNWGYYITPLLPVIDKTSGADIGGTTINGEVQTVLPHIILKVSSISLQSDPTTVIPGPMYLTVKKYINSASNKAITKFEAGNVYAISDLYFGFEDLSVFPEQNPTDYTVTLSVIDWENQLVSDDVD
jgi:hypothetical protein